MAPNAAARTPSDEQPSLTQRQPASGPCGQDRQPRDEAVGSEVAWAAARCRARRQPSSLHPLARSGVPNGTTAVSPPNRGLYGRQNRPRHRANRLTAALPSNTNHDTSEPTGIVVAETAMRCSFVTLVRLADGVRGTVGVVGAARTSKRHHVGCDDRDRPSIAPITFPPAGQRRALPSGASGAAGIFVVLVRLSDDGWSSRGVDAGPLPSRAGRRHGAPTVGGAAPSPGAPKRAARHTWL